MRSRFRHVSLAAAILIALALGLILLLATFIGNESLDHLAGWATIGLVPVALSGFALAIWGRTRASSADGSDLERVESFLSQMLAHEASATYSLVLDQADGTHQVNLRFDKATPPFPDYGGSATGDLASIAEYLMALSPRRLVVLGKPGSGKTVLALELQMKLLKLSNRRQAGPLPVLVAAASYDRGKTWASWLAGHLAQRYLLPEATIARLVLDGRILPIIDGVDELQRAGADALIAELNVFIRERESSRGGDRPSMVITCREAEYQDLGGPLDEATHVEVRSLTSGDVRSYLRESGIEIPDTLASVLTNPLMLSLADTIYGAGADSAQSTDDLLRLPDETAVERHLLAVFLANAYRRTRHGSMWSLAQAERWLAVIGSQMRALATEGYSWRQVAYAVPTGLLGLLSGAATCLGLLLTFTVLGTIHHVFGDRVPLGTAIWSLAAGSIIPAIVAASLVAASNSGQQGKGSRAANPHADLIESRKHALIAAAMIGVSLGVLALGLHLVGVHVLRDTTIVFVCYCMVVTVLCSPWGSFQLARAWFSVRRELPYRLMNFLDDAHRRGVLRSAGPRFEFRNHAVRGYFSDPARLPGVMREIDELTDWTLGKPEIRESYRYVGANRNDIQQAVGSLATETIQAGLSFAADATTRQAALERVRVRLNELGRRSAFAESLVAREAPGLGAVIDSSRVILTRTMDDLACLIDRIPSASVGISGIRGIVAIQPESGLHCGRARLPADAGCARRWVGVVGAAARRGAMGARLRAGARGRR